MKKFLVSIMVMLIALAMFGCLSGGVPNNDQGIGVDKDNPHHTKNTPKPIDIDPQATKVPTPEPTPEPTPGPTAAAGSYYVSTTGNDTNPGTLASPWKTINYAASLIGPGVVINVRAGSYNEKVTILNSGAAGTGNQAVIQKYASDTGAALISGAALTVTPDDGRFDGLVEAIGVDYVSLIGLEVANFGSAATGNFACGVYFREGGTGIRLTNLKVHNIEDNGSSSGNAHGIAIYGTSSTKSFSDLIIDGCEVYNNRIGNSEALVLNGNVGWQDTAATDTNAWTVQNCYVHNNNNIGFDFIGGEGKCTDVSRDVCRNGKVINCQSAYNSSGDNQTYSELSAGGFYVDGGRYLLFNRISARNGDVGMEIGNEHPKTTVHSISVYNSLFFNNSLSGIMMGGWSSSTRKVGYVSNVRYVNCTSFNNGDENNSEAWTTAQIMIQFQMVTTFGPNEFVNCIAFSEEGNAIIQNDGETNKFNLRNCTFWTGPTQANALMVYGGNGWFSGEINTVWGQWVAKYNQYAAGTIENVIIGTPAFVGVIDATYNYDDMAQTPDLHISTGSSNAYNNGQNSFAYTTNGDYDGNPRIMYTTVDRGCYEVQ